MVQLSVFLSYFAEVRLWRILCNTIIRIGQSKHNTVVMSANSRLRGGTPLCDQRWTKVHYSGFEPFGSVSSSLEDRIYGGESKAQGLAL